MGDRTEVGPASPADTVLFVCLAGGLGGSTRSVATVLGRLPPTVRRVLAAPARGRFPRLVAERGLADERVELPRRDSSIHPLVARARAVARVVRFARVNRHRLLAVHANGPEEINVAAPAALAAGVPLVVWSHAWAVPPSARRLGRVWALLLRGHAVRWAAVSTLAGRRLVEAGLVADIDDVAVIPNPIDPLDVVTDRTPSDRPTIGFLGSADMRKGVDVLAPVMRALEDTDATWLLFTPRSPGLAAVWAEIDAAGARLEWPGLVPDVRLAYGRCDIVFCPSRDESFCRVAAEAMLNGIPVVASDIEAVREVVGDDGGILVPVGDVDAMAAALRKLVEDEALRSALGTSARARAGRFDPEGVVSSLARLYGVEGA
jgi:glycosyltransferase involved in cell wall biosynthesis